jgi:neutral ceramidase
MIRTSLIALAIALAHGSLSRAADLRAGAFAQDITPLRFPISVNGNLADKKATAAHDPLHARCLVLDDGKTKLALVVVDSCMIPREIHDAAKALAAKTTGIPAANMLISATHTHTAPTVTGVFQSEPDAAYVQFLTEKIAEGIEKAHARLAPAKAGWGAAREPNQVFNRRWKMKPGVVNIEPFGGKTDTVRMNPGYRENNPGLLEPAGPVDPEVSVLALRTADDNPLVLYANYSLHYVGDLPPLSADYFGVFGDRIGGILGGPAPGFVGMLSNGTSGDVNNVNFGGPVPPPRREVGERSRLVAEAVGQAAKKAADTEYRADITLAAAEKELEFKVRKPTAEELKRAEELLTKAKGRDLKGMEELYARESVLIAKYPDTVKLKVQAFRIGDLGVVAIPCEVFTEIGLTIKEKSPLKRTFTVSLANGYNGYLPTPAQHALGGYETWRARSSYLEVQASDVITETVFDLLKQVGK